MSLLKIKDNNGKAHDFTKGISAAEIVKKIKENNTVPVAVEIDGVEKDLSHEIHENCEIKIITGDSKQGIYILRHSCAHLLAQAVTQLFPEAKPTIGPPVENGFYYDFYMDPINEQELKKIEEETNKIVRVDFERALKEEDPLPEDLTNHIFAPTPITEEKGERVPKGKKPTVMVDSAL